MVLQQLFKKFLLLSFPLKFLIGSIFGIIAGPGLLSFLSEYATYIYAISHNIRPPLEGIPYLSASVALISLVLSIIAISIFLLTKLILAKTLNGLLSTIKDVISMIDMIKLEKNTLMKDSLEKSNTILHQTVNTFQNLKWKYSLIITIFLSSMFTLLVYGILKFNTFFTHEPMPDITVLKFTFLYVFVVLLSLWKPIINWIISISVAISFYFLSFNFLFDTHNYSQYLKVIKYGGEINIELDYKDTRKKENVILILRTRDYLFIKKGTKSDSIEVPLNNIRAIKYKEKI